MQTKYFARPYQAEAIQLILEGLTGGKRVQRGLLILPTGGGKNFVAAKVIEAAMKKKRCLFLADRNELITQPWESLHKFSEITAGIEKAEDRCQMSDQVVVGSIQTMIKRYQRFPKDHWDLIIADEAHLSMSASWQEVFTYFEPAQVIGMTATPFRTDGKDLMKFYEAEFFRRTLAELQDDGWLVPLVVEKLAGAIDLNDLRVKKGVEGKKFDEDELAARLEPHLINIAQQLALNFGDRAILAFLPLIDISQRFAEICKQAGVNAVHIDGQDKERVQKLNSFRLTDGPALLTNSALLHTGIDVPRCSATLNLTPMFSTVRYQQIVGRSTRPLPGVVENPEYGSGDRQLAIALSDKPDSLIIDPMWLYELHGLCIPESLSASSQEEAEEMRATRPEGRVNLGEVQRDFIRDKEEKMLERLRRAQQRKEGVMSVQEFAIRTGDHFLAQFTPVYAREFGALSKFDKSILQRKGIDPDSITCRGQALLVERAINIRLYKKLATIQQVIELEALDVPLPWTRTENEARRILAVHKRKR